MARNASAHSVPTMHQHSGRASRARRCGFIRAVAERREVETDRQKAEAEHLRVDAESLRAIAEATRRDAESA